MTEDEFERVIIEVQDLPDLEASWDRRTTLFLLRSFAAHRQKVGTFQLKNLKKMWETIAAEINAAFSTNFAPAQVENRWRVLERNYKKTKDNNNNKTGRSRKIFEFQAEMDEIFLKKKNIHPEVLLDASGSTSTSTPIQDSSSSPLPVPEPAHADHVPVSEPKEKKIVREPPTKKIKRNSPLPMQTAMQNKFYEEYLEMKRESLKEKKRRNDLIEGRNKILKEYLASNTKLPDCM